MEVIVAIAILLGSTVALTRLSSVGREHAWRADAITRAQVLCQNKLNELLAGITPLQPVEDQPLEYDLDWTHTVHIEPLEGVGLASVSVTVKELVHAADLANRTDQDPRSFRLVRWMRQSAMTGGGLTLASPLAPAVTSVADDSGASP